MGRRSGAYWFMAFPLAVLFVFTLAPTAAGLALSFFACDGGAPGSGRGPRFVGLENYAALLRDARFEASLRNTLVFVALTVPAGVGLGFLLALALHARWMAGRGIVRTLVFLPTVVSIVAVGFVWRWMLDGRGGLLPQGLRAVGIEDVPDFLQGGAAIGIDVGALLGVGGQAGEGGWWRWEISWGMLSIVVAQVWRTVGFCTVLYLAALSGVNESLAEAARIDGASRWRVIRHVTWPQVRPTTVFLLVTGVIGALQVFDIVYALTGGAETGSTTVLNLYLFREFQQSRLGYASAIGAVIFVLSAAGALVQLGVMRDRAGRGASRAAMGRGRRV